MWRLCTHWRPRGQQKPPKTVEWDNYGEMEKAINMGTTDEVIPTHPQVLESHLLAQHHLVRGELCYVGSHVSAHGGEETTNDSQCFDSDKNPV